MLSFENDYSEGAHEKILQRFMETNLEKVSGYGSDPYCESAKQKIREACECPQADVYFLTGGTQTNAVVISSMLESYEGVVAAQTGHVACHEAGAIEYTGHKVLTLPQHQGKIAKCDFGIDRNRNLIYTSGYLVHCLHQCSIGRYFSSKNRCRRHSGYSCTYCDETSSFLHFRSP